MRRKFAFLFIEEALRFFVWVENNFPVEK